MIQKVNTFFESLEFYRYSIMAMTLTAGSCLGSVAILVIAQNDAGLVQLSICSAVSMAANALAIAMAPMKIMLWSFVLSVVVNTLLILINL